ncbi:hypothetical protein JXB12_07900 [candidate division KSB1 bacterium]|nr:hypothetical protein [candidate division KSB1 bacterium]
MAKAKSKGSILLEILIVLLLVALIATIMYPKSVWNKATEDTISCREKMDKILKAELIYLKYHSNYSDSLDGVISFIANDTTGKVKLDYIYSDTTLAIDILKNLRKNYKEADNKIVEFLADTMVQAILMTTFYDSNLANVVLDRLEGTPLKDSVLVARDSDSSDVFVLSQIANMFKPVDIVSPLEIDDSLKLVLNRIGPEIATASLIDTLYKNPLWAKDVDNALTENLDDLRHCPTNGEPYELTVVDTSVIKILNITCPIDSLDIEDTKKDFVLYHLGHLRLENHGAIEAGEKSWLKRE